MDDHFTFKNNLIWCGICDEHFPNTEGGITLRKMHFQNAHPARKFEKIKECPLAKQRWIENELGKVSVLLSSIIYRNLNQFLVIHKTLQALK